MGSVGIAVFRTASAAHTAALNTTIFINVEAHSIAFSALYFWLIPAVILGAVIGVSQTAAAIPCNLRRFQRDIGDTVQLPLRCLDELKTRQFHGGIYTWRPAKYQHRKHVEQNLPLPSLASDSRLHHTTLATTIVSIAVITGMAISALVPPDGLSCRHIAQLAVLACWVLSFLFNRLLNRLLPLNSNNNLLFSLTLIKDILATLTCIADIVLTQFGIFNRCACYTQWGRKCLALPQRPDIDAILRERIHTWYLGITVMGIAVQLVLVPGYVLWRYWDGVRVFVQKDDGRSNVPAWTWGLIVRVRKLKALVSRVRMCFRRKRLLFRKKTRMIKAQVLEGRDAGNVGGVLETGLQSAPKPNAKHADNVQD